MSVTDSQRQQDRQRFWEIHDKDQYICPDCHRAPDEHDHRLEVHHINREAGNIVALCTACHKIRHGAEPKTVDLQFWKEQFVAV